MSSTVKEINCSECKGMCQISFELKDKHEIYFIDSKGMIDCGTNDEHHDKYFKDVFSKEELTEITGDCDDCGQVNVDVYLENGDFIEDVSFDNVDTLWNLFK